MIPALRVGFTLTCREPIQLMLEADEVPASVYKSWNTPNEFDKPNVQKRTSHLLSRLIQHTARFMEKLWILALRAPSTRHLDPHQGRRGVDYWWPEHRLAMWESLVKRAHLATASTPPTLLSPCLDC